MLIDQEEEDRIDNVNELSSVFLDVMETYDGTNLEKLELFFQDLTLKTESDDNKDDFNIKYSDLALYIHTWGNTYDKDYKPVSELVDVKKMIKNIVSLPLYDDAKILEEKVAQIYKSFIFFGVSKNKRYRKIFIFGIPIIFNRLDFINKVSWWIPSAKLRARFRRHFTSKIDAEIY